MDDYRKLSREWGSKLRKEESRQRKTRLRALTELTEDYGGYETEAAATRREIPYGDFCRCEMCMEVEPPAPKPRTTVYVNGEEVDARLVDYCSDCGDAFTDFHACESDR